MFWHTWGRNWGIKADVLHLGILNVTDDASRVFLDWSRVGIHYVIISDGSFPYLEKTIIL